MPKELTYAEIVKKAMADKQMSVRDLEKRTAEIDPDGQGYSYEHLRKLLSGKGTPSQSEGCNAAICKILKLNVDEMWELAQSEKIRRRYGSIPGAMAPADDEL